MIKRSDEVNAGGSAGLIPASAHRQYRDDHSLAPDTSSSAAQDGLGGALLLSDLLPFVRAAIYKSKSIHLAVVQESESSEDVVKALTAMFETALKALCSAMAYKDTTEFRARAKSVLPGLTSLLLWKELSDELHAPIQNELQTAFQRLNKKRGWPAKVSGDKFTRLPVEFSQAPLPFAPLSPFAVSLSCALDRRAMSTLCDWFADRILERTRSTTAAFGIDLDVAETMIAGIRQRDRKVQFDSWIEHQRRINCPITVVQFCKLAQISHTGLYSKWFTDMWRDTDPEGERILNLLSHPWTKFEQ